MKVTSRRLALKRNKKESTEMAMAVETMQKSGYAGENTAELNELIYKKWLPNIFAAVFQGVRELPPKHKDRVLTKMAQACTEFALPVYGLTPCMKWEEFKKRMSELEAPLGPRKITEADGIINSTFILPKNKDGRSLCLCPIVNANIIPEVRKKQGDPNPLPELCTCSAHGVEIYYRYVEEGTGKKVERVEIPDSCQVNDKSECRFLVYLQASGGQKEKPSR